MQVSLKLLAVSCAAIFFAGYMTAKYTDQKAVVKEVQYQATVNTAAMNVNLAHQRAAVEFYQQGVANDTRTTDALLQRVLHITDGLYRDLPATANHSAASSARSALREARLRGALQDALGQYGEEAERANSVARQLNLCLNQLEADRHQVAASYTH